MKRPFFLALAVIIALMAGVIPAFAQETQEIQEDQPEYIPYELADGFVFYATDGWEVSLNEDTGVFTLTDGNLTVDVYLPVVVSELVEYDEDPDRVELLGVIVNVLFEVEDATIKSFEDDYEELIAYWDWAIDADEIKGAVYLIPMGDGTFALVDTYAASELYDENFELLDAMGIYGLAVPQDESANAGSAACFVSTDRADSVEMRVGPGENRSVIAFLPEGAEFTVTGAFTDNDGNLWYQLDKDEIAPDSSAAELWVAQADVTESGDCSEVAEVSAPPIQAARPRTTTGDPGDSGSTGGTGGLVPAEGVWTLTLDATTLASCAGTETTSIPTSDVFEETSFTYDLTVDGETVSVGNNTLDQTAPGNYVGSLDLGDGTNGQFYMFVQSANSASGKVIMNFTQDDAECSATINFGMRH